MRRHFSEWLDYTLVPRILDWFSYVGGWGLLGMVTYLYNVVQRGVYAEKYATENGSIKSDYKIYMLF